MPTQSLILTVLPNGLSADGKSLRFSVLVSPRLDPENAQKILSTFGHFTSWPGTLADARFTLKIGSKTKIGGSSIELGASNVDATIGVPDSNFWRALLPGRTYVKPFVVRDRSQNAIVSYDTVQMHGFMSKLYSTLAENAGIDLPSVNELLTKTELGALATIVRDYDATYWAGGRAGRDVKKMITDYRSMASVKKFDNAVPLSAFQMFHTSPNEVSGQSFAPEHDPRLRATWQTAKSNPPNAAEFINELDFHQIVSAMNQYPTLLRKLGLVLDFIVPRSSIAKAPDISLSVEVKFKGGALTPVELANAPRVASPSTHAKHTDSVFTTVSRPTSKTEDLVISDGLLKMGSRFAVLQADVDGGGHKLMNFARTLSRHTRGERLVDPVSKLDRLAGAPSLRNAGMMLVHRQRKNALQYAFERNKALDERMNTLFNPRSAAPNISAASVDLYAEDLVRGWRIDIWDLKSKKWRSLCERISDYDINKGAAILSGLREEGIVRLAATSSTDGSNPDVIYLHEALTVWNGWSLVAQQPGKAIALDQEKQRDAAGDSPDGVPLKTKFIAAPGTLPRLRFGNSYAIRARAVDLGGNSLSPKNENYPGDEKTTENASPYLRFEPIQPPTIALVGAKKSVQAPLEGESMSRLVVRSFNARFDDPALSTQKSERWATAARMSQREAELHGVLDGAEWGSPQQFALLAERDNELPSVEITPGSVVPATGQVIGVPANTPANPIGQAPRTGQAQSTLSHQPSATYAALPLGTSVLPYLPDPLCTRLLVRLFNHPLRNAHLPIEIPLYEPGKKWPDILPIFVSVFEAASGIPDYDVGTRTLLIPTPKAVRATVRISSMIDEGKLDLMGVWNWIPNKKRTEVLKRRAQAGSLWPLTPWREIEVVHAVQRPLLKPDIVEMEISKQPGATSVKPTVVAMCHRNSTDKVDLLARWHDPSDVPSANSPVDQPKEAVPFSIRITDPLGYAGIAEHLLADHIGANAIAFGNLKKKAGDDTKLIDPKIHDFGDTRYRRVEYSLVGTTRFREYMPSSVLKGRLGEMTDANLKLEGAPSTQWVLNSASPAAPEVLYVVPTFGWTRGVDDEGKTTSWRQGGGLRVWLDRPWNTTGYGEMLAVVIPPANAAVDPNKAPYKQTVTQWGNDPIWKSPFVNGVAPVKANFPLRRTAPDATGAWLPPDAAATEANQPPTEFPTTNLWHSGLEPFSSNGRIDIVPHDVFWDAERRLWYCDIEITHGASYFPFVRLALARYQPSSVDSTHLSNVVMADFCTLAPNRWLTVATNNPKKRTIKVFGAAPEQSSGYAEAFALRNIRLDTNGNQITTLPIDIAKSTVLEVWVEKLSADEGLDFGWHKVTDGVESTFTESAIPPIVSGSDTPKAGKTPATPAVGTNRNTTVTTRAGTQNVTVNSPVTPAQKTEADRLMTERKFDMVLKKSLLEAVFEAPSLWAGTVQLPTAPSASDRYRLVVAEYEEYLADGLDPYNVQFGEKTRRLVFVEHVELT